MNSIGLKSDCPEELKFKILTSGAGYMANTNRRKDLNIKVRAICPSELGIASIFFIATKSINRGDEIFSPYNNVESREILQVRRIKP
jgi:hypothetical protein